MDLTSLLGGGGGTDGGGTALNSPGSASGKGSTSSYSTSGGNSYTVGASVGDLALIIGGAVAALLFLGLAIWVIAKK